MLSEFRNVPERVPRQDGRVPHLSYVYPYPAQGRADRPSHDDPVADVAVRGLRSVTELYSEALAGLRLPNPLSELRIFTHHAPGIDELVADVLVDRVWEGFEGGRLAVPTRFAGLTARARGEVLLEVVHAMVLRLAQARGWDTARLEVCRQHVLDSDLEYTWDSEPKASPDRRWQARARFRLLPHGYGAARLEVSRRDDGAVVAVSGEALAFCTSPGFRRAASSLRWRGSGRVDLAPYDFVPSARGGLVALERNGEEWTSQVEDYCAVLPVPDGDPGAPPVTVTVTGFGATAPEQPWEAGFIGGGPWSPAVEVYHDALAGELRRLFREPGLSWWRGQELRVLEVMVSYEVERAVVRGRRSHQRLRVFVDRPAATLRGCDDAATARADVAAVIALVRRRTGLGPHPGLGNAGNP